jgi:hypothetical protein
VVRQVTNKLSRDLKTRISIREVDFSFFDKMDLEGVLVRDQKQDTLLYAGVLQVRITDWFFLKDRAELKYIALSDATVNLNRTDSVWNYAFLASYFASTDTSAKKEAGISFDLEKVVLNRVRFNQRDAWNGINISAGVTSLDLDAEEISLTKPVLRVANLKLVDPYFSTYSYKALRPYPAPPSDAEPLDFLLRNVQISNGRFRSDNASTAPLAGQFDTRHLDFTAINGTIRNLGFIGDTLRGNLDLKAKERSGLEVKALRANTTIQPGAMIFDDLFLQTNRSTLTNYFSLRYKDNMDDFERRVTMEAHFNKASLSSDDLAFFLPEARTWKRFIRINGLVKGTVDDLSARNLEVWAGDKTYIAGNLSLVGLPDIATTLINFEAKDFRTTYADAVSFVPALRRVTTPNLRQLGYLQFRGSFTGLVNDFVTYGTIRTALGSLTTDINMKLPTRGEPTYRGRLATDGFQLGRFLNNRELGIVDFNGTVKGSSFDWKKLDLDIDGRVDRFGFNDYVYRNITARGNLKRRKFNGTFVMNDPNADLRLNGLIDLSGEQPLFNVKATINRADLQALQLTNDAVELHGDFDLDLQGSSLSNLLGNARITNAALFFNGKQLPFDSLVVASGYVDGQKTLSARSNEFNGTVTGNFDLNSLPESFIYFLNRYYPAYIRVPNNVKPQNFTFDITTGVVEDYIKLIDTSLSGFNNSRIVGSLNTQSNTMTADIDVPYFSLGQYSFSDVQLKGNGNLEKLVLTGRTNNAQLSESIALPQTVLTIEAQNDVSNISISTTSNQTINRAELSAQIKTFSDGATILFNPSSFVLNGKNWSIEQGGELNFRKNTVVQGQLLLKESNQEIRLATHPSAIGNWNDLYVMLRNLNLGDLSPFLTPKNRLEGLLHGDIIVEDPQNKLNVVASLRTDELRFDNDSIGQIQAGATYNNRTGMLTAKGNNVDPDHRIEFDLNFDLKDSANTFRDRIALRPRNFQLKYLERFLGTIATDINGFLTGDIQILGEGADRDYLAKVRVNDASFKVIFTQVRYRLEDTEIELKKARNGIDDIISLDGLRLRDKDSNLALVRGVIRHDAFTNMDFDILVETPRGAPGQPQPQIELLNTTYKDNQLFYGRAMGSGSFSLVGPQNNMLMNVEVRASETDTSEITLPPSQTRASGQAGFLVERKYGREMTPTLLSGAASNLRYAVTLAVTPAVKMQVILDELTGDVIKGRGSGILSIASGTNTPLTINGRYTIDQGNYLFTFQSLFKKPFVLRPGANNYIEWTGDPYKARIALEAIYTAENVSFTPLANTILATTGNNRSLANFRDDVNVVANLTGELFQPNFNFRLEFPSNSVIYRDPSVSFGIQQIEKNPNELNKQVTYLIVFNSFAPYEGQTTANPFGEAISSTISGLLFGEVNRRINELLSSVLQRNNLTLNFSGSLYNRNLVDPNQRGLLRINQGDVNVTVGKSLFDGRLTFTVGGTFDVPIQSDFQQSIRLFPDVSVDLRLNQSGSVRATFFYRENVDFLNSGSTAAGLQTRRYGASLSYGREFDSFGSLLGKHNNKPKGKGRLRPVDSLPPQRQQQPADSVLKQVGSDD